MDTTQPDSDQTDDDAQPETVELSDDVTATEMDAERFAHALKALERAEGRLLALQQEVEALNTGLREEDAVRLLYGRNSDFSLSDIRQLFDTLDTIEGADSRKLTVRLLADLGNTRLDDAEEFFEEVTRLRERYGDFAADDQSDG
jgi:hypothetical protein